jgi:hypothetical protein
MRQKRQGNIQKQSKTKTLKTKAWTIYELERGQLLSEKLLRDKFYVRHRELVDHNGISVSQMTMIS